MREDGQTRSEGIVLLRRGNPEASLYQRGTRREHGREALKRVWQDSYDISTTIELHARVDTNGIVHDHVEAGLQRTAKVVRRPKIPQVVKREDVVASLQGWKAKGYDVSSVEGLLEGDPGALTAAYLALREAVKKADAVESTLGALDIQGFEARAATLRARMKDPLRHPDIDAEVESLRDAIESHRHIEARRRLEAERERDSRERTKKVLELVLKQQLTAAQGTASPTEEEVARALQGPEPTRDEATGLVQQFTFESFVVGESNRFAFGAAAAVAKEPADGYNPLVIVSGPGLGKTHLLHSIGNRLCGHRRNSTVLYMPCETLASQLAKAKEAGSLPKFQERIRGADCLLLDDIQFLSGDTKAQEELLHTMDELISSNREVVLASDRPPKAISDLDEQLVSRLESGVVATIQPPERETRVAILRRRAEDRKLDIDAEVLNLIADLVEDNVRELGGAFNRVVAFSSLMGRPITRDLAREVLREVMPAPAAEEPQGAQPRPAELQPGRSYLVEEERPQEAYRFFLQALHGSDPGLVITRMNPKRVGEKFNLQAHKVLWLTDRESQSEDTIAPALERLVYEIEEFMSNHPRGAILLDGVEYLVSNNSFDAVLKFVRRIVDTVSEGPHVFLISLGPATLKDQELSVLEREMEVVRVTEGPMGP